MLCHSALRLNCDHFGYTLLCEPTPSFTWPVLAGDDARWAVRAAIDAVVVQAYGLNREQYAHVLSTFSHKSYPKASDLCLARFDELTEIGLDAFTKKHAPYWDIRLGQYLRQPVIDLPIPEEVDTPRRLRQRIEAGSFIRIARMKSDVLIRDKVLKPGI